MLIKQSSIKMNVFMNMILTMSSFIFPLISFPYVSRVLLAEGIGKVSFATSLISYFSMFAQLGIPTYGIRACVKARDNKEQLTRTVHELLFINSIMCVITYIALAMCLKYIPRLFEDRILYVIISSTILLTSIGMEWLYKGLEFYTYITVRSVVFKVIALIGMFLLIQQKSDYIIYGFITIFAASASNILNFYNSRKYIEHKFVGNYNIKQHIKPILVFFAMSCAVTVYSNLDTIMLGFMTSNTDVGYYSAAIKIKSVLISVITSVSTVLLPRASYYVNTNHIKEFENIAKKAIEYVFVVALPMIVYFIIFAEEGILFFCGSAYGGSIVPMQIIMPTLLIIGISNIVGIQVLVPLGKEKTVLYSEIIGVFIDIVLNSLLIPNFKSAGAAIGTLFAETFVLIYQLYSFRDNLKKLFSDVNIKKLLIAISFSIPIPVLIKTFHYAYFLTLSITALSFFAIYFMILLFLKEKAAVEVFEFIRKKYYTINKKV